VSDALPWTVEPLDAAVEAELLALPGDMQASFLRIAELLRTFGPQRVGLPHVRPIRDKIWEMRLKGRSGIGRALYVATARRRLVVLHAFVKKTEKTPPRALSLALDRMRKLTP
jgi:phage-related protein